MMGRNVILEPKIKCVVTVRQQMDTHAKDNWVVLPFALQIAGIQSKLSFNNVITEIYLAVKTVK